MLDPQFTQYKNIQLVINKEITKKKKTNKNQQRKSFELVNHNIHVLSTDFLQASFSLCL